MNTRKITKQFFALALAAVILATSSNAVLAAGKNNAAQITMKFTPGKGEKKQELNNGILCYDCDVIPTKQSLKNVTFSETVYIPKKMLSKKYSSLGISMFFNLYEKVETDEKEDINSKDEKKPVYVYSAGAASKYSVSVSVDPFTKKPVLSVWDREKKNKQIKKSKVASVKEGTGKYKKYYILTIKNMPIAVKLYGEKEKTDFEKEYYLSPGFSFDSLSLKGTYKFYVDDVMIKKAGTKLISDNFTNPTKAKFQLHYGKDDVTATNLKVVKF